MKSARFWFPAGLILASVASSASAQPLPAEAVVQQKQIQESVRNLARDLIKDVLDLQLQQLKENGLQKHEWYVEIAKMRKDIDKLVDREMADVIQLLAELEMKKAADPKQFAVARAKSREVLVSLYVQRQSLLRRLRIARIAAEVRQLIAAQKIVRKDTVGLPERPDTVRESENLATLEKQRNVRALYEGIKDRRRRRNAASRPCSKKSAAGKAPSARKPRRA